MKDLRTRLISVLMLYPRTTASPPEAMTSPVNILKVVVLPAPFCPSRPKHSCSGTPTHEWSTATCDPYCLNRFFKISTSVSAPPSVTRFRSAATSLSSSEDCSLAGEREPRLTAIYRMAEQYHSKIWDNRIFHQLYKSIQYGLLLTHPTK